MQIGQQGQFFIDIFSNIAGMQTELDSEDVIPPNLKQYGYLIGVGKLNDIDKYAVKILTENNGVQVYNFSSKLLFNGNKKSLVDSCSEISNIIIAASDKKDLYKRVITYKLNSDKNITSVNTAITYGEQNQNKDAPVLYDSYIGISAKNRIPVRTQNKAFANYFYADNTTKCFIIPSEDRDNEYLSTSYSYYKNEGAEREIHFFDADDMFTTRLVLDVTGNDGEFGSSDDLPMFVVENITDSIINDEVQIKINGYANCLQKKYIIRDEKIKKRIKDDGIAFGDAMRIRTEGDYLLDYQLRRIYPKREWIMDSATEQSWGNDYWIFGKIVNKSETAIKLAVGLDINNNGYSSIGKTANPKFGEYVAVPYVSPGAPPAFLEVNMDSKKMKLLSPKEMQISDFAYVYAQNGAYVKSIVIYQILGDYFEKNFIME